LNKYEIIKKIEDFAPLETQEKWDTSGWIVEKNDIEVHKIMFALTITPDIVRQAKENLCDIIVSHHPLFTVPLEYSELNMYCAHTNFDKACSTDLLLEKLDLKGTADGDFVKIADFSDGIDVGEFKQILLKISPKLRYVNNSGIKTIKKIGFCAGSGSEFINTTNCDAFVTGDIKFHTAVESDKVLFDIGHFESEIFIPQKLKEIAEVEDKGVIADEKSPFIC